MLFTDHLLSVNGTTVSTKGQRAHKAPGTGPKGWGQSSAQVSRPFSAEQEGRKVGEPESTPRSLAQGIREQT